METARRTAPAVIGAGLALGVAADGLFRVSVEGLNATVFLVALAAWSARLARGADRDRPDQSGWPVLAACGFAAMWALRDAETLLAWDLLAVLGLLSLPLVQARGLALRTAGVVHTLWGPVLAGWNAAFGGFTLLFQDVAWGETIGRGRVRTVGAVIGGLVLAVPLVAVFATLFASADPVFGGALDALSFLDAAPLLCHAVTIAVVAWLAAGYLRAAALPARTGGAPAVLNLVPATGLGVVPITTALGAVVVLFTLFVGSQAGSLFRGEAFVLAHTGLTFAEYARGGFFELVAASGLALPVVYAAPFLAGNADERGRRSLVALQGVQLALIALVALSAMWRMKLYVGVYGLSEDRLYASAIMMWIVAMVGVLARSVLAGRPQGAAFGATVAAAVVLGLLNLANPSALIARVNLARHGERSVDLEHLVRLGADAVPVIAGGLGRLDEATRCSLARGMVARWSAEAWGDWRSWNLARARAKGMLPRIEQAAEGCPPSPA